MSGIIVTDGAGDQYEVLDYLMTVTVRSLNRPSSPPFAVNSSTLAKLGIEWDGRTLRAKP